MEKENKKIKKAKKSKYPEGYIGRPKPMKTKTFEFHKPTKKFWIGFSFVVLLIAFLVYIIIRLIQVGQRIQPEFEYYEFDAEKQPSNYIMENEYLKFELDSATTSFSILQKDTGKIWYSNPPDVANDRLALVKEKNNMKSPILVKYSTENGTDDTYDIFTNSVERKFYDISQKGNEVTVNYTIGQMDREYIFPLAIYQSELDKWQKGLTKSQISAMNRSYHKYTVNSFKGEEKDAMLEKYPGLKDEPLYLVFETMKTHIKIQMEETFAKQGYTYDDYLVNKEMYKETNVKEVPAFNITMKYKLEGKNFTVTVPFDQISYRLKYPIIQISVLPYFGAGGENDEGYLFIPEGGGSIINFNNGKTKQNGYYADCYGWDYAVERKAVITETRASFPVFGIAYPDSSFISVINKGAEYAGITAEIAGKLGSYNYVRADYTMLHREQYEVSARSQDAQFVYENQLPQDEYIEQVFTFVDSGSYVDMAKAYSEKMFGNAKKLNNQNVPLAVDVLGAIDKKQQVFGMPKVKPYKLTTYKETADIINEIDSLGIKDVNYRLKGFINSGVRQKLLKKFKFIKQLGGKSDFKKMIKSVKDNSSKLFIDVKIESAHQSNIFNGFFKYKSAARFVSDELCELSDYSPIWYGKDPDKETYYLLNQNLRNKCSDVAIKNAAKYKLAGISYNDYGSVLSSDFNDRCVTTRAKAKTSQIESFEKSKEKDLGIMVEYGNDYSLKYADFITNMKLQGNSYAIIDQFIPFYQIAIHGYVNYSGSPINLGYEKDQILLESAETGSGLLFTFMNESEAALQETNYTEYYSSCFDDWKERFADIYNEYNEKISPVVNSKIVDHCYLTNQVTKTTFENGYVIYVNFGYKDYETPTGKHIPERDYRVMKVED